MGSVSSVKDAQAWPLLAKAHSSETPFRRSWGVLADVDRLNPPLRQDFLIDMPASACLRRSMICSSVNRVVFISAILQSLRTYCHYLGTAGRGQVTSLNLFFTSNLLFCGIGLQSHLLLKFGGTLSLTLHFARGNRKNSIYK